MDILKRWQTKSFFGYALLLYVVVFFFVSITQQGKIPPISIVTVQFLGAVIVYFCSLVYSNRSISTTLFIIFLFQLSAGFGLRYFNVEYFGDPLGYKPMDSLFYHRFASHTGLSFSSFINYLFSHNVMMDDMGQNIIEFLVYQAAGSPEAGMNWLVFVNSLAITLTCYFVYLTAMRFFEQKVAMFMAFFWGMELFAVYVSAAGLKENFMVMFIVIALFYTVKLNEQFTLKDFFLSLLFASAALLFRLPVFYMLVACILFVIALRLPLVKRYFYVFMLVMLGVATIYYYQTIDEIALQRGYSYDILQELARSKSRGISSSMMFLTNTLAAFFGPFPTMLTDDSMKVNYITLYSFSSFCKLIYSFFFAYGLYGIIRFKKFDLVPMVLFWALDTFMLLFTLFALHDRYQWPHMPFTLIIAGYGVVAWYENRHVINWKRMYVYFALSMIVVYNFR